MTFFLSRFSTFSRYLPIVSLPLSPPIPPIALSSSVKFSPTLFHALSLSRYLFLFLSYFLCLSMPLCSLCVLSRSRHFLRGRFYFLCQYRAACSMLFACLLFSLQQIALETRFDIEPAEGEKSFDFFNHIEMMLRLIYWSLKLHFNEFFIALLVQCSNIAAIKWLLSFLLAIDTSAIRFVFCCYCCYLSAFSSFGCSSSVTDAEHCPRK